MGCMGFHLVFVFLYFQYARLRYKYFISIFFPRVSRILKSVDCNFYQFLKNVSHYILIYCLFPTPYASPIVTVKCVLDKLSVLAILHFLSLLLVFVTLC